MNYTYYTDVDEIKKAMIDVHVDTIGELAENTGINRNTLTRILKRKEVPSTRTMLRLAGYFQWTSEKCGQVFFAQEIA